MAKNGKALNRPASDTAASLLLDKPTLASLREAAAACRACDLWERGTQTVFGEGAEEVELLLVGEQPGDVEDHVGRPFVGPAGRFLDEALEAAGIEWSRVYLTNVVNHFKWEPRGKRRIHGKPNAREIRARFPWLQAEIETVAPRHIVCLGATAARALLGSAFRLTHERGRIASSPLGPSVLATVHPASILRAPDEASRRAALAQLIDDLKIAAHTLG